MQLFQLLVSVQVQVLAQVQALALVLVLALVPAQKHQKMISFNILNMEQIFVWH